jgi:acetyltransferase-like isoleucine patch superfamily enzyme
MTSGLIMEHDWFRRPLPDNVELGPGSWLYSAFSFVHCRSTRPLALRTGCSCGIYNGCSFELGPRGEVHVGDYCTLVGVIFATNCRVIIGAYCFLSHEVVIADRSVATPWREQDFTPSERTLGRDSIVIGDDVWVGAGAVLLNGAQIGDGAVVGAAAVVDFEVPPLAIVAGNPARIVGSTDMQLR